MQEERPKEEQQMIAQWEAKFSDLYGNGWIFANALSKAIQDWDLYKKTPFDRGVKLDK